MEVHPKVQAAAIGGAFATVIVWLLSTQGIVAPPEVAAAIATLSSAVLGYITPE